MLRAGAQPKQARSRRACAPAKLSARNTQGATAVDTMKQHLAVSAIGSDRTGMVHELTRVVSECGGNISESRMAGLGSEFAMLLLVSGNWHALAKLETELKRLADSSSLILHLKRTEPRSARTDMLPYSIDVVCLDQTGIVSGLSGFFSSRSIDIAEVSTRSYPAAHTGAPMFSVQMIVNVPSRIHVAHLREEFMEFCDSLNLDAISGAGEILKLGRARFRTLQASRHRRRGSWSLKDAAGEKLVIYFYPKDMTSGCTPESQDFRDLHAAFRKARHAHRRHLARQRRLAREIQARDKLPFELLADEDEKVVQALRRDPGKEHVRAQVPGHRAQHVSARCRRSAAARVAQGESPRPRGGST